MKLNKNYERLADAYLFSDMAARVSAYKAENPDKEIIRLGIGDVTLPLPKAATQAMKKAVEEMENIKTFRGYGDEQGYLFLREKVKDYYAEKGVTLDTDEIFISDGAKSDLGNILDLFDKSNVVLVPDPVYPVYVDTNIMDGRKIINMVGTQENGFCPLPDESLRADIIYVCSPNNPTGAVYDRDKLKKLVDIATRWEAVILFDAAYEAFVCDSRYPTSIYEIEGAESCAIEFCSLSKTAGFTGTRLGYTVVPKAACAGRLNNMWRRRQTTKFNGVGYIVQRGGEGVFSEEGRRELSQNIAYYRENASLITATLDSLGIAYMGGANSPYIWMKCPDGLTSMQFFDFLLEKAGIVGTPGAGFGEAGEGWFRLTAFNTHEKTNAACRALKIALDR